MMKFLSIRVSILGLAFAGLVGSAASAEAGSVGPITTCSFSPTSQILTIDDLYLSARTDAVFSGSTAYVKTFIDGSFNVARTESVASGNIEIGPVWQPSFIGQTWRFDYYADESSSTGSPLCSFTVSYVYFAPPTPITSCVFNPVSVVVPTTGTKPQVALTVEADGGSFYAEQYVDGSLITFDIGQISDLGDFPYPDWNLNIAGKTWRIDFYASSEEVNNQVKPVGSRLCSLTATYASVVVDSGPGSNGQTKSTLAKSGPGANRDSVLSKDPKDRGNKPTR